MKAAEELQVRLDDIAEAVNAKAGSCRWRPEICPICRERPQGRAPAAFQCPRKKISPFPVPTPCPGGYTGAGRRERDGNVSWKRRRMPSGHLRHRPGIWDPHSGHLSGGGAAVFGRVPSHCLRMRLLSPPLKGVVYEDRCLEVSQGPAGFAAQAFPRREGMTALRSSFFPAYRAVPGNKLSAGHTKGKGRML